MANKINSMTLESGVKVDYLNAGDIRLTKGHEQMIINTTDLDTIRLQAIKNARIEAGNGVIQPEKEKV